VNSAQPFGTVSCCIVRNVRIILRRRGRTALASRTRLYMVLRTAILEQARDLAPATIIYRDRRYDFDEVLAAQVDLVQAGPMKTAWLLLLSKVREFETNEPLMRIGVRGSALAVASLRVRGVLGGGRATIVTYAIENLDPFTTRDLSPVRSRLSHSLDRYLTLFVWRNVDRIVFGTDSSYETYRAVLPAARASMAQTIIPTLSQICPVCPIEVKDPSRVVFLGALVEHKGFSLLMSAWPLVTAEITDAELTIMGIGPLEETAIEFAAVDASVEVLIDPSRAEIHRQLRRAQILTLPSQPLPIWKEQLGLPITEALAHGCSIVSTDDTGLSDWLSEHGHLVIPTQGSPAELARALVAMLRRHPSTQEVLGSLPERDGRLAADDWMFSARHESMHAYCPHAAQADGAGTPSKARRFRRSRRTYQT
jgi:glycosyltransferase involved in cell wall biosynthesis